MEYTTELIGLAEKFKKPLSLYYSKTSFRYTVKIENVVYKSEHIRQNIEGNGYTIEDSCYDFVMKARRGELENYLTNEIVPVV